ncbi:MAG: SCO family protein, partial [Balneolales bacterium]|nr:SCO family protein [Balneolales bacterium]
MGKRILTVFTSLILAGCSAYNQKAEHAKALPFYEEASFTPVWFQEEGVIPEDFHRIPEFNLTNQSGETITRDEVEGKIYVVDFFFASCSGICPKLTTNMGIVQHEFADNDQVLLLSHSVTPTLDTVRQLRAFANTMGVIDGKWHLLTGDRNQIYDLGKNYYFAEENLGLETSEVTFIHTENFLLIDQNGYIRGVY